MNKKQRRDIIYKACEILENTPGEYSCDALNFAQGLEYNVVNDLRESYVEFYSPNPLFWFGEPRRRNASPKSREIKNIESSHNRIMALLFFEHIGLEYGDNV